jgi:outer membrane protein OmpA-like peptidoglycan-associated protein
MGASKFDGAEQAPTQAQARAPIAGTVQPAEPESPQRAVARDGRLERAASAIDEVLRRAEIANHRELADAIAPVVAEVLKAEGGTVAATPGAAPSRPAPADAGAKNPLSAWLPWLFRAPVKKRPEEAPAKKPAPTSRLNRLMALERSGFRVVANWRAEGLSAELTSNLVAAIKQFSAREFASPHDELRVLNLHGGRVLLRASERLIVAGQFLGEPAPDEKSRLDEALKTLVRSMSAAPSDAELARVAARLASPPPAPALTRKRLAAGGAVLALAGAGALAWSLMPGDLWRPGDGGASRLQGYVDAAQSGQGALAGWPLGVSLDRENHVAMVRGVAPAAADLDAFARALPDSPPWRWDVRIARVATPAMLEEFDAALSRRTAALGARLDKIETWRTQSEARDDRPEARLAQVAQATVILFRDDEAFLDADLARRQLAELAARLKATDARLRVVGYSDARGSAAKNLSLSRARADAVARVLQAEGVEARRLVAVGRAAEAPIEPEGGADRRRNRRVTFEVLAGAQTP